MSSSRSHSLSRSLAQRWGKCASMHERHGIERSACFTACCLHTARASWLHRAWPPQVAPHRSPYCSCRLPPVAGKFLQISPSCLIDNLLRHLISKLGRGPGSMQRPAATWSASCVLPAGQASSSVPADWEGLQKRLHWVSVSNRVLWVFAETPAKIMLIMSKKLSFPPRSLPASLLQLFSEYPPP